MVVGDAGKIIEVYRCHVDPSISLCGALQTMEMQFGYQKTDVQHELAEISIRKQADMSIEGMRELLTDLSYSYVKASFGKPDLLNQDGFLKAFSNHLPQKLHSDFFGKIADLPSISKDDFQFSLVLHTEQIVSF